jgi:HPt (histidine-containing phosphotransfer) domain-containing protein
MQNFSGLQAGGQLELNRKIDYFTLLDQVPVPKKPKQFLQESDKSDNYTELHVIFPKQTKDENKSDKTENIPVFDRCSALSNAGGDNELLSEILEMFLENLPVFVKNIYEAYKKNDTDKIFLASHSLKGSCSIVGAFQLCETARQLEKITGQNNTAGINELIQALGTQSNEFENLIKSIGKDKSL